MGNGAMAIGPQLPRPSSTLPSRRCPRALVLPLLGAEPKYDVDLTRSWRKMALSRLSHSLVSGGDIERNHGVFPQSRLSTMRYRRSAFRASAPKVHRV